MAKNDSYAGQLIDEIKQLKEENKKLSCLHRTLERNYKVAMINLANSRDEIDELEEQIAMMKCCENCYYRNYIEEDDEYDCGLYWIGNPNTDECIYDHSCRDRTNAVDRWKLKE